MLDGSDVKLGSQAVKHTFRTNGKGNMLITKIFVTISINKPNRPEIPPEWHSLSFNDPFFFHDFFLFFYFFIFLNSFHFYKVFLKPRACRHAPLLQLPLETPPCFPPTPTIARLPFIITGKRAVRECLQQPGLHQIYLTTPGRFRRISRAVASTRSWPRMKRLQHPISIAGMDVFCIAFIVVCVGKSISLTLKGFQVLCNWTSA